MGKIVKGAKVVKEAYVLAVPEIEREPEALDSTGLAGFGASNDDLAYDDALLNGNGSGAYEAELVEPEIDFEQVRADARALIDKASSDGEAILRDAAARAKEMVERANARVEDIESQARSRAHDEGVTTGRAAGYAELEEDVAAIHELIDNARAQRNVVIETAEPELVRLAMAVAERVVYDHVAIDPNVVLENVRHALTRIVGREIVTMRVNPADAEILRKHREGTAASNDVEHLRIVEDQRVDRGGVVVETDAGTIDAKISTQLREARRALTNGDVDLPQAQVS
ncbi:MAG TPA: FliH/SctL family protein [Candidatus Baltobacteraceae bacterium]|nr:FliH/SctL family protein [Candidatus Baltobacteraceae bacterium]